MADPLDQYDPPACIDDFPDDRTKRSNFRSRWDQLLSGAITADTNFYDPKVTPVGDAPRARVEWTAFPKRSEDLSSRDPAVQAEHADGRNPGPERQYEYCEWCVERDRPRTGDIVRVTFTTEVPLYYETLWAVDPGRVLELYQQHVNRRVQLADLGDPTDPAGYQRRNPWTIGPEYEAGQGGSMHMVVGINTLPLAVGVVQGAAGSVPDLPRQQVNRADPVIELSVGRVVGRLQQQVSFTNPVGIYLQEPDFNRVQLPSSAPADFEPSSLWRVVRGRRSRGEVLRAEFRVPEGLGFNVSDVRIDDEPIRFGSQIARIVRTSTYVTPLPRS